MPVTSETLERQHTNPEGFPEVDADRFKPMKDKILVKWEEKKDTWGNTVLLVPDTHKKRHYTGVVLQVGPWVDDEIKLGSRLFFEQFAGFEKFFDPKYGRLALIKQNDALAVVPARTKIESDGGGFDYDR